MSQIHIQERDVPSGAYEAARASGFTDLQARIIAARLPHIREGEVAATLSPQLSMLDPPSLLPDIDKAVQRLADAIETGERLLLISDHDVDGGTGLTILKTALLDYFGVPLEQVRSYTSHRMREGYGVSDALVTRILADNPGKALAVTCDQGSADAVRIARLREQGIDTIVTDHHEIPTAGIPAAAVAVVNPIREDSAFPDKSIAGCYVAFLVMCALRDELIRRGRLPATTPKLTPLLSYAACGTVADCVNLANSRNNRAVVRFGLYLMNTNPLPCWRAVRRALRDEPITAETIAWFIAPRINGSGRVDDSMVSVDFLMAKEEEEAAMLLARLDEMNAYRKELQERMLRTAKPIAQLQDSYGVAAIVIYLPDGHAGIHGICSSRLTELYGRPSCIFSPKQGVEGVLTASLRSIEGINLKRALDRANEIDPGCTLSHGGHAMAAGASTHVANLERFQIAFRAAVAEQRDPATMRPLVLTDGALPDPPDLETLTQISALEPFGRSFPAPIFEGQMQVAAIRRVGDGRHLKLELHDATGNRFSAIWFGACQDADAPLPMAAGDRGRFVYTPAANTYRGNTTVDLRIQAVQLHEEAA